MLTEVGCVVDDGWLAQNAKDWSSEPEQGPKPEMALEEMFKALEWLNSAIQKQEARSEPSIDEMSTLLEDAKSPLAEVIESIPTVLHKLFTALAPDGALDERYAGDPYSRKVIINALRLHNYLDSAALNELFYVKTSLQLASEIDEYMGEIREHLHWLAPGATDWCQEVFQGGGAVAELVNIKVTLEDIDAALEKLDKQVWSGSSNIIEEAKSLREKLVAALPSALTELCDAWSTDGKIIESRSSSFRNAFELFAAGIAVADYAGVSTSHLKSLWAQWAVSNTLKRSARLNAEHSSAATAEIEAFEAEKRAWKSVEATLPDGTTWTFAEQYVLLPGAESLIGLVSEKLEAMPDSPIVRVTLPRHSLILHHADRGYIRLGWRGGRQLAPAARHLRARSGECGEGGRGRPGEAGQHDERQPQEGAHAGEQDQRGRRFEGASPIKPSQRAHA